MVEFADWRQRSLSTWITMGLVMTVVPLFCSITFILWLNARVVADLDDVTRRYRDEVNPTHRLELFLWEAAVPLEAYLDAPAPVHVAEYRALRIQVEGHFARLGTALARERRAVALVARAERDWSKADQIAVGLLGHKHAPGDAQAIKLADELVGLLRSATDKLRAVEGELLTDLQRDHAGAQLAAERSKWITGIMTGLSLISMLLAVMLIGRIMLANIDRLVTGARRFAAGDREHKIDVQVPPELRDVANELNVMAARIKETEARLQDEARNDALTGLSNRRCFDEALKDAYARMRRLDERIVLLAMDVDHFKYINDAHGHSAGDDVLRAIGQTVRATVREVDKAFRTGGEEFAVLLVDTDLEGAAIAAERLRAKIETSPVITEGATIAVTASIGLARADASVPPDELLRRADRALYAAKSGGRNRVEVEPERA